MMESYPEEWVWMWRFQLRFHLRRKAWTTVMSNRLLLIETVPAYLCVFRRAQLPFRPKVYFQKRLGYERQVAVSFVLFDNVSFAIENASCFWPETKLRPIWIERMPWNGLKHWSEYFHDVDIRVAFFRTKNKGKEGKTYRSTRYFCMNQKWSQTTSCVSKIFSWRCAFSSLLRRFRPRRGLGGSTPWNDLLHSLKPFPSTFAFSIGRRFLFGRTRIFNNGGSPCRKADCFSPGFCWVGCYWWCKLSQKQSYALWKTKRMLWKGLNEWRIILWWEEGIGLHANGGS